MFGLTTSQLIICALVAGICTIPYLIRLEVNEMNEEAEEEQLNILYNKFVDNIIDQIHNDKNFREVLKQQIREIEESENNEEDVK